MTASTATATKTATTVDWTRPLWDQALERLDEVTAVDAALGDVNAALTDALGPPGVYDPLHAARAGFLSKVLDTVRAGARPDIGALADEYVAAETRHRASGAVIQLLGQAASDLRAHRDRALGRPDEALRWLDGVLGELLDAAAELEAGVAGYDNADDAIAAGHGDDWGRFAGIARQVVDVRDVQRRLVEGADGMREAAAGLLRRHGEVSSIEDLDPVLQHRLRLTDDGHVTNLFGAPEDPEPVDDPVRRLKWLLQHRDMAWVPTVRQLRRREADLQTKLNEASWARDNGGRLPADVAADAAATAELEANRRREMARQHRALVDNQLAAANQVSEQRRQAEWNAGRD